MHVNNLITLHDVLQDQMRCKSLDMNSSCVSETTTSSTNDLNLEFTLGRPHQLNRPN
jgi:hypothetical protein